MLPDDGNGNGGTGSTGSGQTQNFPTLSPDELRSNLDHMDKGLDLLDITKLKPNASDAEANVVLQQKEAEKSAKTLMCDVVDLISSDWGLLAGFLIAAYGFWTFLQQNIASGVIWLLIGVSLTTFPGIWGGILEGTAQITTVFGGQASPFKAGICN